MTSWKLHKGHYVWAGPLPDTVKESVALDEATKDGEAIGYACKADALTYRALCGLGMSVPSPTEDKQCKWLGQHTPMQHQRKTVASMLAHKRSFVLDDPGTGKTLAALWGLDAMRQAGTCKRCLIVAPLSIVHGVWWDELFLTTQWRCADLTKRSREKRLQMVNDKRNEVLLINPESLTSIAETIEVDAVIVDEFTAFKSASAQRSKALKKLLDRNDPWTVLMSGTPAPQGPVDAYFPIKMVNPKAARMTKRLWQDMTEMRISEFKWVPKVDADQTVTKWLQPGTRTSRDEALDLPTLQTLERRYQLSREQSQAIKQMKQESAAETSEGTITAANAAVAASKMLQILTGHVRMTDPNTDEQVTFSLDAKTWLEAIENVVSERHEPVLIFVPFRAAARAVSEHLSCPIVVGDTSRDDRSQIYDDINKGAVKAVVAVSATMSHGLTLTGSNCVLWALPPASAEQYQQANARVYRKGQSKPVDIIHLVGHSFVQALFTRTDQRMKLQQAVLDALSEI